MKFVIIAVALVAAVAAAPPGNPDQPAQILRSEFDQQPEGGYVYSFETDNGISRSENGEAKQVVDEDNKPQTVIVVRGSYSYTDNEGKPVSITYTADETGFHPEGDVIPKPARR